MKRSPTPRRTQPERDSLWIVSGSGNTYEVIALPGQDERAFDYRLKLVELGAKANNGASGSNRYAIGDEILVERRWFDLRAQRRVAA